MLVNIHTHTLFEAKNTYSIQNVIIPSELNELETWNLPEQDGLFSVGIHPWYCSEEAWVAQLEKLEQVCEDSRVVAIGECGLDALCATPKLLQEDVFRKQIRLAERIKKPMIIHCVKAFEALIGIQKVLRPTVPMVIHGFAKNTVVAEQLLKRGFYLSLGHRIHSSWNAVFYQNWKEQLFAETDTLENTSIETIYAQLAHTFDVTVGELAETMEENYWFITAKN